MVHRFSSPFYSVRFRRPKIHQRQAGVIRQRQRAGKPAAQLEPLDLPQLRRRPATQRPPKENRRRGPSTAKSRRESSLNHLSNFGSFSFDIHLPSHESHRRLQCSPKTWSHHPFQRVVVRIAFVATLARRFLPDFFDLYVRFIEIQ